MNYKDLDLEYMENFQKNPKRYEEDYRNLGERVANSKALFRGKVVPYSYKPLFFTREDVANFDYIGRMILKIGDRVVDQYIKSEKFREKFGFPKELEELILLDSGYGINVPMSRIDIFYGDREDFKFCELNTDGSSAMLEDNSFAEISLDSLGIKDLEGSYSFSYYELIDSWVEESLKIYGSWKGKNKVEKPNIAILDFVESATTAEFLEFQKAYRKKGYQCEIVDPRNVVFRQDGLYDGDFKIDMVYRRLVTFEMMERFSEVGEFLRAYKAGAFCSIGSFRSQLIHNKLIFKVLHDEDTLELMNEEERKFILNHVPDTGEFKGETKVFQKVLNNKDSYIMKPSDMNVARGVFVGRDLTQTEWEENLREAFNRDYIYQEFIEAYNRPFLIYEDGSFRQEDLNSVVGIFMYGEKFKGLYTRIGSENVISSVTSYRAANLIVEEK